MKHVGSEINNFLSKKQIGKTEFAQKIGMSGPNLSQILKKKSIDSEQLELICNSLEVPISYFFDDTEPDVKKIIDKKNNINVGSQNSINNAGAELEAMKKEIEYLKQLLIEKERYIKLLENSKL